MIVSIIVIFFLTRSIAQLAEQKGEEKRKWKIIVILAWLTGDILGELIILAFFGLKLIPILIFGLGFGFIGYLLVKQRLDALPDIDQ